MRASPFVVALVLASACGRTSPLLEGPTAFGDGSSGGLGSSSTDPTAATAQTTAPASTDPSAGVDEGAAEVGTGAIGTSGEGPGGTTTTAIDSSGGAAESTGTPPPPPDCEAVTLEYLATDASLDGDWALTMSQLGEGTVAAVDGFNPSGDVTFTIDVPCDDNWIIWVRGTDYGSADSFFARLDGAPEPPAIFELDCGPGGGGYTWQRLNWRDPDTGGPCEYVVDPWLADWTAGEHTLVLGYREAIAIARVVVTNDPGYVPP